MPEITKQSICSHSASYQDKRTIVRCCPGTFLYLGGCFVAAVSVSRLLCKGMHAHLLSITLCHIFLLQASISKPVGTTMKLSTVVANVHGECTALLRPIKYWCYIHYIPIYTYLCPALGHFERSLTLPILREHQRRPSYQLPGHCTVLYSVLYVLCALFRRQWLEH